MPGAKEIRTQIKSIGSTRKITKAMETIAALRGEINASPEYKDDTAVKLKTARDDFKKNGGWRLVGKGSIFIYNFYLITTVQTGNSL